MPLEVRLRIFPGATGFTLVECPAGFGGLGRVTGARYRFEAGQVGYIDRRDMTQDYVETDRQAESA